MMDDRKRAIAADVLAKRIMYTALGVFALFAGLPGDPAEAQQAAPTSVLALCLGAAR